MKMEYKASLANQDLPFSLQETIPSPALEEDAGRTEIWQKRVRIIADSLNLR